MAAFGTTFFYGAFEHPKNEVAFNGISRQMQWSETGRANIFRESWSLRGRIVKPGMSAIMTALNSVRSAYSYNGRSAGLRDPNGLLTSFYMNNNEAIGGVIVTDSVSHGAIEKADGVNYLNYTFGLQMDSFSSAPDDLLSYSEQLSFSDNYGGPLLIGRVPLSGPPIIQAISTHSFFYATQSGSLTCRTPNPQPEAMIFPGALMGDESSRQITFTSGKTVRGVPVEYGVSWVYKYRSISPFFGMVNTRG